jgi:hypothetical protein
MNDLQKAITKGIANLPSEDLTLLLSFVQIMQNKDEINNTPPPAPLRVRLGSGGNYCYEKRGSMWRRISCNVQDIDSYQVSKTDFPWSRRIKRVVDGYLSPCDDVTAAAHMAGSVGYQLGVIDGKRIERAKKKKPTVARFDGRPDELCRK